MSKKHRIKRKEPVTTVAAPAQETTTHSRRTTTVKKPVLFGSPSLILFDRKVIIFISLLLGLYVFMSAVNLHTSSVTVWEKMFGNENPESLKAGQPRPIRQDEWMVVTPSLIGQYQLGMPKSNHSLGDGNVPVIWNFPVKDVSMLLRPSLWSYFIFDVEHAFAFSWNFPIFFFLITTFLLFMLLTRNQFWLSVFGTFFIFLSGAMQWWSYSLGALMLYANAIILALAYLIYSRNVKALVLSGVVLCVSAYSFLVAMYPPWQVPLVYVYAAVFLGFIFQRGGLLRSVRDKALLRGAVILSVLVVLGVFLFHFYGMVKPTYEILLNTVYPGRRSTNGGDLVQGKLFSEMFGMYMADDHVPAKWLNICEASSLLLFFPVIFYGMGYQFFRFRKFDWLQLCLSASVLFLLAWVLLGFPSFLSKLTLLSMSPAYRALPILGVANAFLLVAYLGNRDKEKEPAFSWLEFSLLAVLSFIFFRVMAGNINKATEDFFKPEEVMLATLLMTAAYVLIRYRSYKFIMPLLFVLLLGTSLHNLGIHPLTSGLSSLLDNPIVVATKGIAQKDPGARWAVFGNQGLANLLKVNGIQVFNGVKAVPMLKDMAVLDPRHKKDSVYNRYAHINLMPYIFNDSVDFHLNENAVVNDNYTISMDPCSPRLKQLGIKYFAFTYAPQEAEIRCMARVSDTTGISIYTRKD